MLLSDGQNEYVKVYNSTAEKAILLIHGGPGDGSVSFGLLIRALEKQYAVIEVDQRGCCRSEQAVSGTINLLQILKDYEEIRQKLRIRKWYLLGHSFGGFVALSYAAFYQDAVAGVILENPAINLLDSVRCILNRYILFLEREGMEKERLEIESKLHSITAQEGLAIINGYPNHIRCEFWGLDKLNEQQVTQLSLVEEVPHYFEKLAKHAAEFSADPSLEQDGWKLAEKILCPVELLYGEWDPITDEVLRRRLMETLKQGTIVEIQQCGHYLHLGQTAKMYEQIRIFIGE